MRNTKLVDEKLRQDRVLAKLNRLHRQNELVAQRIIKAVEEHGGHLVIMVSSSGLRFIPKNKRTTDILSMLLRDRPSLLGKAKKL